MMMNITGINTTISNSTSSIIFDTYPSRYNFTTSIKIKIENGVNTSVIMVFNNISICNFFKPHVTVNAPIPVSSHYFNISWSSTDKNADDTAYYSIWLSNDGGESYQLLKQNYTQMFFLWNSSGWLETEYKVRIRTYSVDLSYFGGPFVNIPADYWPGDYADGYWTPFSHHDFPNAEIADVGVVQGDDLVYILGSVNNQIEWHLAFEQLDFLRRIPDSITYTILYNGQSYINATQNIGEDYQSTYIIVQVDGLGIGVHNFTLVFMNPGVDGGIVSDTVLVTVQVSFEVLLFGGSAILLVSVALIIRSKRVKI
jgi:hypothetical protein